MNLTWNADQVSLGGRQYRTSLGVGWRNYKRSGLWLPINTDVQSDRTITSFPGNVEFPISAQGWTTIVCDHDFSIKRKIDEGNANNSEPELSMELQVLAQHNVTGTINPDDPSQRLYENAWDTADLLLGVYHGRAARIQKIIKIKSMPSGSGDIQYQFKIRSSQAKVFVGPNFDQRPWNGNPSETATVDGSPIFIASGDSQIRGSLMKTPVCWWFENGERQVRNVSIDFVIESDGETVTATKNIPRAYVTQALAAGSALYTDATFTPDASPETTSVDGLAADTSNNLTWANLLLEPGSYSPDSESTSNMGVSPSATSNQYEYYRHLFFLFDTSSIGSGQTVDSATLALWWDNQRINGSLGLSSQIYSSSPASNTAIVNGDYMAFGSTPLTDAARDMESESFDWTEITQTLNSDGRDNIDMEGITKMGLGVTAAHESGSPTWASNETALISVRMAEYTGTSSDPLLTVTHSAASSGSPWNYYANQGAAV